MEKIERINVWYDKAGDYLDVHWVAGNVGTYFTLTGDDQVMVLVDAEGNRCGFKVSGISKMDNGEIVDLELSPVVPATAPA